MSLLPALGYALPLAVASGLNLYATVAVLGLCSRFQLVALPDHFRVFEQPWVIGVALVMYAIEFVADKIPWFDSVWDVVHTIVRPLGGALIAVTAIGTASPAAELLAALLGGSVAMTSHLGKAGTRAAANTSPEPFSNWILSLLEDGVAVALTYLALQHPYIALTVALIVLAAIAAFASVLVRLLRRRFRSQPHAAA